MWIQAEDVRKGDLVATTPDIPIATRLNVADYAVPLVRTYSPKQQRLCEAYRYAKSLREAGAGVQGVTKAVRSRYGTCNTNWFYGVMPRPLREVAKRSTYDLGWIITCLGFSYGDGSLAQDYELKLCLSENEAPVVAKALEEQGISFYRHHSRHRKSETIRLYDYVLSRLLHCLGLPIGDKQGQRIPVPTYPQLDDTVIRLFLSGLYGAEGSPRIRGLTSEITL